MTAPFMQAAASYFGLGETKVRRSELFTDGGELVAVFEVVVTGDDMAGIAERMKALQTAQAGSGEAQTELLYKTPGQWRDAYDRLSKQERSRYGSLARFVALGGVTSDAADFGGLPG